MSRHGVGTLARLLDAMPEDPERFRALCGEIRDWGALLETAERHELQAIFHHYLADAGVVMPDDAGTRSRQQSFFLSARQSARLENLLHLTAALEAEGIVALPLKGPALAARIYPLHTLRASVDLDLLVSDADFDRAVEAIARLGYRCVQSAPRYRYYRSRHYHISFLNAERGSYLELHFRAVRAFGATLDAADLISRAIPVTLPNGRPLRVLEPEDEITYLVLHAAKHFVLSLKWLYDLKLFLLAHPNLSWSVVMDRVRRAGFEQGFLAGLREYEAFFPSAPVPLERSLGTIRGRVVDALKALGGGGTAPRSARTSLGLVYEAVLGDRPTHSLALLGAGFGRIARRRARRYLGSLVPEAWEG